MIDFKKEVLKIKDEMIQDIQTICRIDSVLDYTTVKEDAPFGKGCRDALDCMLSFAQRDGFVSKDVDGYAGHIDLGEGDEVIGVLGHLDVVPVNKEGWTYPPFSATLKDGVLYGRGTSDDKGPTIAAYYAAKIVHRLGLPEGKKIRIIFGCDEESGSRCMKHYFSKEPFPKMAFTPDASFPVCYGEKSGCSFHLQGKLAPETLISLNAGTVVNIVPETATAVVSGCVEDYQASLDAFCKQYDLQSKITPNELGVEIQMIGKSAHASLPDLGKNAIVYLASYLNTVIKHPLVDFIDRYFKEDNHGRRLGFYFNGAMGEVTVNMGIIHYQEGNVDIKLDLRCPHDMDFDGMVEAVKKAIQPYGLEEDHHIGPYLYIDPTTPWIQKLHQAYVKYSNDVNAMPMTMGGGTYAKSMPNTCVAFGMEFPGTDNHIHENNECLLIDELLMGTAIYAEALYQLMQD